MIPDLDGQPVGPRRLITRLNDVAQPAYSVCIMVTDPVQYAAMTQSFLAGGFTADCCEYLVCDNRSENRADAYVAYNEFLQAARAPRVLLCHQDLVLMDDGKAELDARLDELDHSAPDWAVAGNAGMTAEGWPVTCLSEPNIEANIFGGALPRAVITLDENFIAVRREANLALSRDLGGFHHYGTDLCLVADMLGWSCHVIDFLLRHNSAGNPDHRYHASAAALEAKYARAFTHRQAPTIIGRTLAIGAAAPSPLARLARFWGKLTGRIPRNRDLWAPQRHSPTERHRAALSRRER